MIINEYSDIQIVKMITAPSTANQGMRLLMNQYQERLYWKIREIVKNHESTADVLQNVFVKIFKNISKFNGQSKLYTWIHRIAINEALDTVKKNNRHKIVEFESWHSNEKTDAMTEIMEGDYIIQKLQSALETLPSKQREIFELRYFEEKSYKEISKQTQTSEGGLKASYHHAAKKIELYLKQNI